LDQRGSFDNLLFWFAKVGRATDADKRISQAVNMI
jgi:hypothetical protein